MENTASATEKPISPDIQAIYAHHVLHGTGTFEEVPPSVEEMAERFARGAGAAGAGWWRRTRRACSAMPTTPSSATAPPIAYCAEDSVYVREDVRGQGVGKALVARLIEDATAPASAR